MHIIKEKILSYSLSYYILRILKFITSFFEKVPHLYLESKIRNTMTIMKGPFAGLIWHGDDVWGGSFLPMMLGEYEKCIHPIIYEFKKYKYHKILNLGSAEGYYANGLAKIFNDTQVEAIDINSASLKRLEYIAKINSLSNIKTISKPALDCLNKLSSNFSYLIICDIEGSEFDAFNILNINNFKKSDLIIEMHYLKNDNINKKRDNFTMMFKDTHNIKLICPERPNKENYPQASEYTRDIPIKYLARFVETNRESNTEWLILKSNYKNIN